MLGGLNGDFVNSSRIDEPHTMPFTSAVESSKSFHRHHSREVEPQIDDLEREHSSLYEDAFERSIKQPEEFWAEIGRCVDWDEPWDKILDDSNSPHTKWYVGGKINACYNTVDRHVEAGRGEKVALIHDSPQTHAIREVTYAELLEKVALLAGALADLGVTKGDRVLIYMPLIPETIMAILATARLGAVHSVVFGGFAANELACRIDHAKPKVIVSASCGLEPNKIVKYTIMLNEALELATFKRTRCIIYQRRNIWESTLSANDLDWELALKNAQPHPCVPVEANDPLYILYTSGTTDKPKGIERPVGGHIVTLCWTMKAIYGINDNSVWWVASDMGWVVGHSYICYGPLLAGITSVMYEGKPDRTPDAGEYFRVIEKHQVNALFTVPTVFRVIRRVDPEVTLGRKFSLKSLRTIFMAGEHCDHETKTWAENVFKVPIYNHWWQTETGHAITATCIGLGHVANPPPFTAGLPFPGYDVKVLRADGSRALPNELGRIAIKLPLPPGTMSNLYLAPDRFEQIYFSKFPGFYDTMDAGYIDERGYVYVTARDDDVINVSGHRLSTFALEDVVLGHPRVADAAVVGVPESTKGEIPLCLYVVRDESLDDAKRINEELVARVRDLIGPIAAFKLTCPVKALPRTRSGKICRKFIADLARSKRVKIPSTIEDPTVYASIREALQEIGYAIDAPEPE